jgi:hypothetical protein
MNRVVLRNACGAEYISLGAAGAEFHLAHFIFCYLAHVPSHVSLLSLHFGASAM